MKREMKDILNVVKETTGKVAKVIVPILIYGGCAYLNAHHQCDQLTVVLGGGRPDKSEDSLYGRAIKAICDSDTLWSCEKERALKSLKRDQSDGYYEAVIAILKSRMDSCDQVKAIRGLE